MKIPKVIYHYTTKETFLKIFDPEKTPELRMYPANQMNDPMECKWLLTSMKETIYLPRIPKECPSAFILSALEAQNDHSIK